MAESKIRDDNYYQISGWMINRLGLKGAKLNVFAIIYGFSQDGESEFTGSRQYLSDFINASKPTVDKALSELCDDDYLLKTTKIINNVTFNTYKANLPVVKKLCEGSKETLPPSKETCEGGSKETLPNNKSLNNKNNNKDNNKGIYISPLLGRYENIKLKEEEYDKLKSEFSNADDAIEYLSEYIEYNPSYKKKSHYLAIRKWVFKALKEEALKDKELAQREQRAKEIEAKQKDHEERFTFKGKRLSDLTQAEYEEYLKTQKNNTQKASMHNWLESKNSFIRNNYTQEQINSIYTDLDNVEV